MKREDSKKHYKEEKPGLRNETILKYIFFALILTSSLDAQIPINGFCRYREFALKPGYTNLKAIDYNSDGYRDLVVFNPQLNSYLTLTCDAKSNFGKAVQRYSSLNLALLHTFSNESNGKQYLALSRKTREISEVTFSRGGSFSVSSRIKIDGYASSIDVGELNNNGFADAVASGAGINGIKILKVNKNRVTESYRIVGKVFSETQLIDLNYDSFPDIAAVDLTTNSIVFYVNNTSGDFDETRSVSLGAEIKDLRALDFNNNGFTDLTYLKNGKLEILEGDSVSSFQKKIIFPTNIPIDEYIIYDFNADGLSDVAFISKAEKSLYISYAMGVNEFYPPVLYLKKENLVDLVSYVDRGGRKLVALSSDGKVYLINTLSFQEEIFSVSFGDAPITVGTFDYQNDSFKDIAFIDASNNLLKIGLSERRNLFRTYFEIPISTKPSAFLVDEKNKSSKTFFCYEKGGKTIEVIRFNFEKRSSSRIVLYTDQPILELKYLSNSSSDMISLFALTKEDKKLFLQTFEIKDFVVSKSELKGLAVNVENATLNMNVNKEIFSLAKYGDKFTINKTVFEDKVIENKCRRSFSITPGDSISGVITSVGEFSTKTKSAAIVISSRKKSALHFFNGNENYMFPLKNYFSTASSLRSYLESDGKVSLFANVPIKKKLFWILADSRRNNVKESTLIEMEGVNDYLVTNINGRNRFLLLSNSLQNSIIFKKF